MKPHGIEFFRRKALPNLILTSFAGLVVITGCLPSTANPSPMPESPTLPPAIIQSTSTPGRQPIPIRQTGVPPQPVLSATPPPLRFNLPSPAPAPVSLWRPPLYDIPWALGPFDHFYFSRPIAADVVNWPDADYRYGGIFFDSELVHTGIDVPAKSGTPVLAAAKGKIVWAGYGLYKGNNDPSDPYGLAVTISHDFSFHGQDMFTVYAHMESIDVVTGQVVERGEQIGAVGKTGNTTGPHLHFEVRTDYNSYFTTLNPELWLTPPQGWGVLAGRILNNTGGQLISHPIYVRNKKTNQQWKVLTYGKSAVNGDPYYHENMVLSDLPGGLYEVSLDYRDETITQDIDIFPGAISFFTFRGDSYYDLSKPPVPGLKELTGPNGPKNHP